MIFESTFSVGNESLLGCVRLDVLTSMHVDSERCSIVLLQMFARGRRTATAFSTQSSAPNSRAMNGKALTCLDRR